jgi:hypothetical protein
MKKFLVKPVNYENIKRHRILEKNETFGCSNPTTTSENLQGATYWLPSCNKSCDAWIRTSVHTAIKKDNVMTHVDSSLTDLYTGY